MRVFNAHISVQAAELLNRILNRISHFETANERLKNGFGINDFFGSQEEYEEFKGAIFNPESMVSETVRSEYGDFQTNTDLAKSITNFLREKKNINPEILIEPTCGKGNFIIAALSVLKKIEKVVAIEIYKPYTWEAKFNIIDFYVSNPAERKPEIEVIHYNVFDYDFKLPAEQHGKNILVLGNPPWVTNSKLSVLESNNLPPKSNFKKHNGIDAITGKGNFDIGEYITLMMLDAFQHSPGHLAFLVKNSVVKNVVFDQHEKKYSISGVQKLNIDSKKEFDVSVDASLLFCRLNTNTQYTCKEYDFYKHGKPLREFGWVDNKFVSNTEYYKHTQDIDGVCRFEWRQGIKHDLSAIMEFERANGKFVNGKGEEFKIEEGLIYGVLKSSDLKEEVISKPRKFTIVTQKKTGQDTSFIKTKYSRTYEYLESHKEYFNKRKSSIYKGKPDYSIFGVGEYSFTPYKVAISGLYKTFLFSLILPYREKPLMLDDTCYLLGFDNIEYAVYTLILLNSDRAKEFLKSITFSDAKRTFTKEVLMRVDLYKLAQHFSKTSLIMEVNTLNENYNLNARTDKWDDYLNELKPQEKNKQMKMFVNT